MNIALVLCYDGTDYHGWQVQKNGTTIQEVLTDAIEQLFGTRAYVSGVGRTDAGVHARNYVANFHMEHCAVPLDRLPLVLNGLLPAAVAVRGAVQVPEDFDARFECIKKEYAYYIYPAQLKNPFIERSAYRCTYPLDVAKMHQAAAHFVGKQDFAAVRSMGTPVKSTVRTIFHCVCEPADHDCIRIRVCGDGFLYNMVRSIAGTLLYVGNGKWQPDHVRFALDSLDRKQAGPTLPACGLFMNRLWYDNADLMAFCLDQ